MFTSADGTAFAEYKLWFHAKATFDVGKDGKVEFHERVAFFRHQARWKTADGQDARHAASEGDVFFFAPRTRVGYYSSAKEGQPHDLILAVRSNLPGAAGMGQRGGQAPPAPAK